MFHTEETVGAKASYVHSKISKRPSWLEPSEQGGRQEEVRLESSQLGPLSHYQDFSLYSETGVMQGSEQRSNMS